MHGRHPGQISEPFLLTLGGEALDGFEIGAAGIRVGVCGNSEVLVSANPTFEEVRQVYPLRMTDLQRSHEEGFVRAFIEKSKQDRCISFLASPKHRRKFTVELGHFKGLDDRFSQPILPKTAHTVIETLPTAEEQGCWTICLDHFGACELGRSRTRT